MIENDSALKNERMQDECEIKQDQTGENKQEKDQYWNIREKSDENHDLENTIQDGDFVYVESYPLRKGQFFHIRTKVPKMIKVQKRRFKTTDLIGMKFDEWYDLVEKSKGGNTSLKVMERVNGIPKVLMKERKMYLVEHDIEVQKNNDKIGMVKGEEVQMLTTDEISNLKKEEIVDHLIEKSSTFESKSIFSQQKYIKRKKERHELYIRLRKPTIQLISDHYFEIRPEKIDHMRPDTLGQLLYYSGARSGSNVLCLDSCDGLSVAALYDRFDGDGRIFRLFEDEKGPTNNFFLPTLLPNYVDHKEKKSLKRKRKQETRTYAFTQSLKNVVIHLPSSIFGGEETAEQASKVDPEIIQLFKESVIDSLIICGNEYANLEYFEQFLPKLAIGGQFVIYSQLRKPIEEIYTSDLLKKNATYTDLREILTREYQVLPQRTHPMMTTFAASGFLLSGIRINAITNAK